MDEEKLKDLFEEKYQDRLNMSFDEWMALAPQNETEAYAALEEINQEIVEAQDKYDDADGDEKWEIGEYKEMLQNKYQLIEEMFGLESQDE